MAMRWMLRKRRIELHVRTNYIIVLILTCTVVIIAAVIGFSFFGCAYICKRVFPDEPLFTPLELDDIRIERETDIESALSSQIDNLKVSSLLLSRLFKRFKKKLTLHRKRKTELQTKRDIAATIEDRIESYNDKGRYE